MKFKIFITKTAGFVKKVATHPVTKKAFMLLIMFTICLPMMAQGVEGITGFDKAVEIISNYQRPVKNVIYAIAALVGLMGAASIYIKMNNGDQDIKKSLMMTIGGCVALICLAQAIPAFFPAAT